MCLARGSLSPIRTRCPPSPIIPHTWNWMLNLGALERRMRFRMGVVAPAFRRRRRRRRLSRVLCVYVCERTGVVATERFILRCAFVAGRTFLSIPSTCERSPSSFRGFLLRSGSRPSPNNRTSKPQHLQMVNSWELEWFRDLRLAPSPKSGIRADSKRAAVVSYSVRLRKLGTPFEAAAF